MLVALGTILVIWAGWMVVYDRRNFFLPYLLAFGAVCMALGFLIYPAASQHVHPDETITDPRVSSFYEKWLRPPNRSISCCNKADCYSAKIRRSKSGGLEYLHKWTGTWAALPPGILEENQKTPLDSPNTENHVCANPSYPEIVYCAVRSSGT